MTSCKDWGKNSIANRCEISKKNELCYRCLRSGHQGKNCPENNGCGINDCKGTHHFHVLFECRYRPPEETQSAFDDSEFAGDVVMRTVPILFGL